MHLLVDLYFKNHHPLWKCLCGWSKSCINQGASLRHQRNERIINRRWPQITWFPQWIIALNLADSMNFFALSYIPFLHPWFSSCTISKWRLERWSISFNYHLITKSSRCAQSLINCVIFTAFSKARSGVASSQTFLSHRFLVAGFRVRNSSDIKFSALPI